MSKGGNFELEIGKILSLMWSNGTKDNLVRRTESSGGRFTRKRKQNMDPEKMRFLAGDLTYAHPDIQPLFELFNIEAKTGYMAKTKYPYGFSYEYHGKGKVSNKTVCFTSPGQRDKWLEQVKGSEKHKNICPLTTERHRETSWCVLDLLDSSQKTTTFIKMWEQSINDAMHTKRIPLLIFRRNNKKACIAIPSNTFETMETFCRYYEKRFSGPIITVSSFNGIPKTVIVPFQDFQITVADYLQEIVTQLLAKQSSRIIVRRKVNG